MDAGGAGRLNRSSPSCLNRPAQRTAFFHGLLTCHGNVSLEAFLHCDTCETDSGTPSPHEVER